ncbi:MAG TPA: DNA polymerase III subunit gamma/tau [Pyrinomonadaceae bacterium]|nr:DNA polymerase III subunit gamma/tau [Pyrinomonadaceae bacterium]
MTYQVIARKWRPQSFAEVTGQEPITRTLTNAIEHERLHHAYLFSGARGVGKTTTARLLAKALNCHKSDRPTPTPCRADDPTACASCKEITESRSIDVQEIDAASNTGVDNVREAIIGSVAIAPARDRFKLFIIDEVHMLSGAAFNALLKTIEEPPSRVVFIMATTERHKVPETILSRCQQFEFRTIANAKILERLRLIAQAEKISIPEDALRELARAGEGSMRDAQSAFDQVISFAGTTIKKEDVEMALGVAGADILIRVINGIAERKPAEALAVVEDVVMRGHDLRNFCRDVLAHLRDLLVTKVAGSSELLESAVCDERELKRQAALFSESDLVRFFHSLAETETNLKTAAHPRYQVEIGLVKLMEMQRLEPLGELIERLNQLEESFRTGKTLAPAKTVSSRAGGSPTSTSGNRTTAAAGSNLSSFGGGQAATAARPALAVDTDVNQVSHETLNADSVSENVNVSAETGPLPEGNLDIDRLKSGLERRRKMFLVTALESARRAVLEGGELYIEFAPDARHLRDTLAKSDNVKILREVCLEITRAECGVRIVVKDDSDSTEAPVSKEDAERLEKQRLRKTAEESPVVQQILKTFRGEITDVRRVGDE